MQTTKTIKVSFPGWKGNKLDGRLELPSGHLADDIKSYVIICNCFTCTKETITTFRISKELAQNGYATLRFDFSGLGDSEGVFSSTSFTSNVHDVVAASNFLHKNYHAPSLLLGHSLGGTAALVAAMQIDKAMTKVRAISTIASPSQPSHILHHFGNALTLLDQGMPASIEVAGQQYEIEPSLIQDLMSYDMEKRLASMKKPVLIFNIKNDELVGESNAIELDQWIKSDSVIITLKNTNHLISNKQDTAFVVRKIISWYEALD